MIRRLRLVTGLVLFAYVTQHLVNHALGMVSLDLMEWARPRLQAPVYHPLGAALLYAAFATHIALAFHAIYIRRTFRAMQPAEVLQLALGLMIPPLLILHVVETRLLNQLYSGFPSYPWMLARYLDYEPWVGLRQLAVLFVAWVHGCCGVYFWLSVKPWWPRAVRWLHAGALLLPVLAFAGVLSAGKEVSLRLADPAWEAAMLRAVRLPEEAALDRLLAIEGWFLAGFAALLGAVLVARLARSAWAARAGIVRIRYDDGRTVRIAPGATLLEASRAHGVPHASVCGGRGRCSTCRVQLHAGEDCAPPPAEAERRVLDRIAAGPGVRLACQLRPRPGALEITRLLPPTATARDGFARPRYLQGQEMEITVLFADIRGFTRLSESRLPYDVVFVLNRYFDAMGQAISEGQGYVDKFIGDGAMALFGIGTEEDNGARNALFAARRIGERIAELNESLKNDLEAPLSVGIGVHVGPAIVGEMGYGRSRQVTAIGDTVNVASRLEQLTKTYGVSLVASLAAAEQAGLDPTAFERHEAELRGREGGLPVAVVHDLTLLPDAPGQPPPGTVIPLTGPGGGAQP